MKGFFAKNGVSLDRLHTLTEVIQEGSYVRAAKGDQIKASLISRQMKELKEAVGQPLLDKERKPTDLARRLADSYNRFIREVEEIVAEANGKKSPISVGAGEVVIREILIRWIRKQKKEADSNTWIMRNLTGSKIQEGLRSGLLDLGIADRLEKEENIDVVELVEYGYKLVLPEGEAPDKSGWQRLSELPLVIMDGVGRFRRFLEESERENNMPLKIGAECTTYTQVVDLAEATGYAFFVPEYLWKSRLKDWKTRTHELPGLEKQRRTLQLGWNTEVIKRRPEVIRLVNAMLTKKA